MALAQTRGSPEIIKRISYLWVCILGWCPHSSKKIQSYHDKQGM